LLFYGLLGKGITIVYHGDDATMGRSYIASGKSE
jgi:hypothetical protein